MIGLEQTNKTNTRRCDWQQKRQGWERRLPALHLTHTLRLTTAEPRRKNEKFSPLVRFDLGGHHDHRYATKTTGPLLYRGWWSRLDEAWLPAGARRNRGCRS